MLDCLTIDASGDSPTTTAPKKQGLYWIDGTDLLQLAQFAMDGIDTSGAKLPGDGSYRWPWALTGSAIAWIALAKELQNWISKDRYFWICGRFVKKAGGYYMVDAGGDGGLTGGSGGGRAWDQNIIWDRYQKRWKGVEFERGGPSYRNYANYMEKIQADSKKGLTNEEWSQHKAEKLRRVLKCDPMYASNLARKGDWTTGQILPVLAATMFLAEPARNIRAFLANKMILDMMQAGITYGGRKTGSSPKQYVWSTTLLRDPQDKGGKMPAAMAGSAKAAYPIAPDQTDLGSGFYTQAKELTLLCHFFTFNRFQGTNESLVDKKAYTQIKVTGDPVLNTDGVLSTPAAVLGYLKYLLQVTARTWDL